MPIRTARFDVPRWSAWAISGRRGWGAQRTDEFEFSHPVLISQVSAVSSKWKIPANPKPLKAKFDKLDRVCRPHVELALAHHRIRQASFLGQDWRLPPLRTGACEDR